MTKKQIHDFAATSHSNLPKKVKQKRKKRKKMLPFKEWIQIRDANFIVDEIY